MEAIKLYDLTKEVCRSMRFFDSRLTVEQCIRSYHPTINCVIVKSMVEEDGNVPFDRLSVEIVMKIEENKIFGECKYFVESSITPFLQKTIGIRGKILVLAREGSFIEIDVIGNRQAPSIFNNDVRVRFKDPIERDIAYISENYPDIYKTLLTRVKYLIEVSIAMNEQKKTNLARIISFINKIEGRGSQIENLFLKPITGEKAPH